MTRKLQWFPQGCPDEKIAYGYRCYMEHLGDAGFWDGHCLFLYCR